MEHVVYMTLKDFLYKKASTSPGVKIGEMGSCPQVLVCTPMQVVVKIMMLLTNSNAVRVR